MKQIVALPLLLVLFCSFAFDAGKYPGSNFSNGTGLSVQVRHSYHDTIPESEISKINPADIESISTIRDVIYVKLKNGDSVLSKKENYTEKRRGRASSDYDEIFTKVEQEASYPGGQQGWMTHLIRTFRYPIEAQNKKIQGTVVVQFVVDKQGKVSNIEAVSGPTRGGLRNESERVIKASGKWVPAMQNGQEVKSYKTQSVIFKLE